MAQIKCNVNKITLHQEDHKDKRTHVINPLECSIGPTETIEEKKKNHKLGVFFFEDDNVKDLIATDFAGQYLITSKRTQIYFYYVQL